MAGSTYHKWGTVCPVTPWRACPQNCVKCGDVQVLQIVEPNLPKQQENLYLPSRRRVDLTEVCKKCHSLTPGEKKCPPYVPEPCRSFGTSLHIKKTTDAVRDKPNHKFTAYLDPYTVVGRVYPMKFRLRRRTCKCAECAKVLAQQEIVTGNEDLLLLSDCCNVQIYPRKEIDNWERVPVFTLTKVKKVAKQYLCDMPDPVKPPAPEPVVEVIEIPRRTTKKGRKSKKRKKGKKSIR